MSLLLSLPTDDGFDERLRYYEVCLPDFRLYLSRYLLAISASMDLEKLPLKTQGCYVRWVCSLPIEVEAARRMLDWKFPKSLTPRLDSGCNTCIFGIMGANEVVIAWPKENAGNTGSAITVAKYLLSSFPGIKLVLLVGIGSGIPNYEDGDIRDVRLCDVVISSDAVSRGLMAYEFHAPACPYQAVHFSNRRSLLTHAIVARLAEADSKRGNKIIKSRNAGDIVKGASQT